MDATQIRFYHGLANFWIFPLPVCKGTADFAGAFKSYLAQSETTNAMIEGLTRTRGQIVLTLSSNSTIEQKMNAVDEYLPFLYQLYESLIAHEGGLRADKELVFEWRCYLGVNTLPHFRSTDIVFELIMVLHLKASLHYYLARNYLDTDLITYLTEAGKQLVNASGIIDTIEANMKSNKWNRAHYSAPNVSNPAETSVAVLSGLSLYYRSLAQILAIIKGAANVEKPTPLAVKTRLSVAVINLSANALRAFETSNFGGSSKFSNWLQPDLMTKVAINREIFTALAYFYQSKLLQEKQEIGFAVAYAQFAQLHLAEQSSKYNYTVPGLPKSAGNFSNLASVTSYLNGQLNESIQENDRTNRFVTFQVVPNNLAELPPLPAEAVIMNSVPFKEPVVEEKQIALFILPEKKSFFGSLFRSKSKSMSTEGPGKAEDGNGETESAAGGVKPTAAVATALVETTNSTAMNPSVTPQVIQGQVVYYAPPPQANLQNQPPYNPQGPTPHVMYQAPAPQVVYQSSYYPPQPPPATQTYSYNGAIQYPENNQLYPNINQYPISSGHPSAPGQPYLPTVTSSVPPAVGAPPTIYYSSPPQSAPVSDEEYARQLQQQYNQEAQRK